MDGRFTGPAQSVYGFDHGKAERGREQAARERAMRLQERCEFWLTKRLAGQTFDSRASLETAARALVLAERGDLSDELATAVTRACRDLFFGLVDPRKYAGKILVTRGERVKFLAA